jgi:DNA-binding transcriptional ArsR family regulator
VSAVVGWEAEVRLPRDGNVTATEATGRLDKIALAYGIPRANVVVEPLLTGEEDRFRVMVLERNPLQQVQIFTGLSLDVAIGRITIGMHADRTPAYWQLWRTGWGACHGMIAGTTGAGKSALLQILLTEARHSGVVCTWLGDPDNGSNQWKDNVDCYAGSLPRIRLMLRNAEAVMQSRASRWTMQKDAAGRRRDTSNATPTVDEPLILVVIDESPDVLADPECQAIIARIGKRGRKWLVGIVVVTLVPALAEMGNNLTVRSMLSGTNVVMFRTSDKLSAQMGSLASIDPHSLPPQWPDGSTTAGLGYLGNGTRLAPFRGLYVPADHDWATRPPAVGAPATLRGADVRAATKPSLYYGAWRDLLDVPVEAENDDDSELLAIVGAAPTVVPAPTVAVPTDATTKDRIVAYLDSRRGEHVTTGVIAQALAVPLPTVSQTLARLRTAEQVVQVRRGMWAMPGEGLEVLDESA